MVLRIFAKNRVAFYKKSYIIIISVKQQHNTYDGQSSQQHYLSVCSQPATAKVGVVVAVKRSDNTVGFGFSLCAVNLGDKFNPELALNIALWSRRSVSALCWWNSKQRRKWLEWNSASFWALFQGRWDCVNKFQWWGAHINSRTIFIHETQTIHKAASYWICQEKFSNKQLCFLWTQWKIHC